MTKIKHLFTITTCLAFAFFLITSSVNAQETLERYVDSTVLNLDKTWIHTGILLTHDLDNLLLTSELNGTQAVPISYNRWLDLNNYLNRACVAEEVAPSLSTSLEINRNICRMQMLKNQERIIPLFLNRYNFETISNNAISDNLLSLEDGLYEDVFPRTNSPYIERKIICAGIFFEEINLGENMFLLKDETIFSNDPSFSIVSLEIDAGDGLGFRPLKLNVPFELNFLSIGLQDVSIKIHTPIETLFVGLKLKIKDAENLCHAPYGPDKVPWLHDIKGSMISSIPYLQIPAMGNVYLKYGLDGQNLDKPFILVEGIDFGIYHIDFKNGDLGFCQIFGGGNNIANLNNNSGYDRDDYFFMEKYPLLIESLRAEGYDVFFLDFWDGADYVERNSMLLVELIQRINQNKVGCEKIVVAGASMGGQIGRYALRYMEQNNLAHEARMYISLDSPHQGSYIPAGLQHMIKFMAFQSMKSLSTEALKKYHETLFRPAARQLLNYNVTSGAISVRNAYYANLNAMGYPNVRKIGVANGTRNGVGQGYPSGIPLFHFSWTPASCGSASVWNMNVNASPGMPNGFLFQGKAPSSLASVLTCLVATATLGATACATCLNLNIGFNTATIPYLYGSSDWDNCPGGKRRTLYNLERDFKKQLNDDPSLSLIFNPNIQAFQDHHSFIPTTSALDINTTNPYITFNNNLPLTGLTPFDAVYAPENFNEQHSEATFANIDFVLNEVLNQEDGVPSVLNSSTPSGQTYNYVHAYQNIGSTLVEDDGKICFNCDAAANYLDPPYFPINSSNLEISTSGCGTILEIQSGGEMGLGSAAINTRAKVIFSSGSKLILRSGSKLTVHDGSELILESGSTFICEEGSEIVLEGSNAKMNVKSENVDIVLGTTSSSANKILKINSGVDSNGGVMKIFNGNLKMMPQGELIVSNAKLELGDNMNLLFNSSASIKLIGTSANLDFGGTLNIASNTMFTFLGDGFVSFSKQNAPYNNITAGSGSSFRLTGSSQSDEILRVNQKALYLPDNLTAFSIKYGTVKLSPESKLVAPAGSAVTNVSPEIQFINMKLTSTSGLQNGHLGLELKGQNNVAVLHSLFENGKYGINANLFIKNNPLMITSTTFQNNEIGLRSQGAGITLSNSKFNNNQIAWSALAVSLPSSMQGGSAIQNGIGIEYKGTSTSDLVLKNTKINQNSYGIIIDGPSTSIITCSEIKQNEYHGIQLRHGAKLNMSTDMGAGYVNASGNGESGGRTIYCEKASRIFLNNGYNDLSPHATPHVHCSSVGLSCYAAVEGNLTLGYTGFGLSTFYGVPSHTAIGSSALDMQYCSDVAFTTLPAQHNIWSIYNTVEPRFDESIWNACWPYGTNGHTGEYSLYTSYKCPLLNNAPGIHSCKKITVQDPSPLKSFCTQNSSNPVSSFPEPFNPLSDNSTFNLHCKDCPKLNTFRFEDSPLNVALQKSIKYIGLGENANNLESIQSLSEILNFSRYENLNTENFYLLDLAHEKMASAFGYALLNNEIPIESISDVSEVALMEAHLNTLNSFIQEASKSLDVYDQRLSSTLELAMFYRTINERTKCINTLESIRPWAESQDFEFLEFWICIVKQEQKLVSGELEDDQMQIEIEECTPLNAHLRTSNRFESESNLNHNLDSIDENKIQFIPNPFSNSFILNGLKPKSEIQIFTMLGELIYQARNEAIRLEIDLHVFPAGIYFAKVTSETNEVSSHKLVKY